MVLSQDIIFKTVLLIGLIAFLSFGTLGLGHVGMGMEPTVSSTCPFMPGMTTVCKMNPLGHIAAWQSMFTTTLQQSGSDLFALLLAALALALIWSRILRPKLVLKPQLVSFIAVRRENRLPRSPLQELFSNGILHSKVF